MGATSRKRAENTRPPRFSQLLVRLDPGEKVTQPLVHRLPGLLAPPAFVKVVLDHNRRALGTLFLGDVLVAGRDVRCDLSVERIPEPPCVLRGR